MKFKVIDTKTGKEPTRRVIDTIAKECGLMEMDIDQFFVGEDGSIVLADDCCNIAYCDNERFKAVAESEKESMKPTEKQIKYAQYLAQRMGRELPKDFTKEAYSDFISKWKPAVQHEDRAMNEPGAWQMQYM